MTRIIWTATCAVAAVLGWGLIRAREAALDRLAGRPDEDPHCQTTRDVIRHARALGFDVQPWQEAYLDAAYRTNGFTAGARVAHSGQTYWRTTRDGRVVRA